MKVSKKRARFLRKLEKQPLLGHIVFFLRRLKKRLWSRYLVMVSEEYNAIYFPITKVASTSLSKAFSEAGFEKRELKKLRSFDRYYKFAFYRDPYDRLKSCWRDKISPPCESGVIAQYPKFLYEGMPLDEFIGSVRKIPEKRQDKHFIDQERFITGRNGQTIVDDLYDFHDLENEYKRACRKIGIKDPPKLDHYRKT